MHRFQVHLTARQMTALRGHRQALGLPMAELIRRALDAYLTPRSPRVPARERTGGPYAG